MNNKVMFDFTLTSYSILLKTLLNQGFSFQTFEEFITNPKQKAVVLRHDIDKSPKNAERIAEIETSSNIVASYHFRIFKESNEIEYIKKIVDLGHEIGYHYERQQAAGDRRLELKSETELLEMDFSTFKINLKYFRKFYPVKVISMHGSPKSRYDSKDLWKQFNYRDMGIICEPYFDIDYSNVLYLTDTGRRWNGNKFNLRDKVFAGFGSTSGNPLSEKFNFRSTFDIIRAILKNELPDQIIINAHPQRWTDKPVPWVKELVWQNVKNVGKYFLVRLRS
jgi:hypothetical protein